MSISGISSNTSFLQQSNANLPTQWQRLLQGRVDFTLLAEALGSGDLVAAQEAFADLQNLRQSLSSRIPIQNDFAALGKALASNDLFQAQTDLSQLMSDVKSVLQSPSATQRTGGARGHHRSQDQSVGANTDTFGDTTNPMGSIGNSFNLTA